MDPMDAMISGALSQATATDPSLVALTKDTVGFKEFRADQAARIQQSVVAAGGRTNDEQALEREAVKLFLVLPDTDRRKYAAQARSKPGGAPSEAEVEAKLRANAVQVDSVDEVKKK